MDVVLPLYGINRGEETGRPDLLLPGGVGSGRGKPRIVSQRYHGSAAEIAQILSESGPGEPDRTRHLAFGDLAAMWAMLGRLGVGDIVDEVVGARRAEG
ncbi:MAG: hypothetical protein HYR89_03885 [Actinobacteria bacterium]|nr:hypothetical protein [Actinomycetota bacterium]